MKIHENLLTQFKKANKTRKTKLLSLHGFETAEAYIKYLEEENTKNPQPEVVIESIKKEENITDMIIAFDTTGSMRRYIKNVKDCVKELISSMIEKNPNLHIGIVAFGDYIDMPKNTNAGLLNINKELVVNYSFGKAYQSINLTNSITQLSNFIKNNEDTGGGDSSEFYDLVLYKIRTETNWRKNSKKVILLIGDSDNHKSNSQTFNGYFHYFDYREEIAELVKENIQVDTLEISDYKWYKELSTATGGLNLKFSSSQKTSQLLEGYSYAVSNNTKAFKTMATSDTIIKDTELTGLFKQLNTKL